MKRILLLLTMAVGLATHAQIVTTIAGNGTTALGGEGIPATATGEEAGQIAMDRWGNIYYPERNSIRRIDTAGIVTTIAGSGVAGYSGDGGQATAALLNAPGSLAIDNNGNIYIGQLQYIRKIDAAGIITTYAGTAVSGAAGDGDGGPATNAHLGNPLTLLADAAGNLYVYDNRGARHIDASGIIHAFAGDFYGTTLWGEGSPATAADVSLMTRMAMDSKGNFYFAGANYVRWIDISGIMHTLIAGLPGESGDGGPATAALYNTVASICIDSKDNIYLGCINGGRIRRIDATTGLVSTYAGTTVGFSGDGGQATAAQFGSYTTRLLADCGDNIYLTDAGGNNRIRKITVAHNPYYVGESDALNVCQNTTTPCGSMLQAENPAGAGEAIEWDVFTAPMHGTIGGAPYVTTVTSGAITPTLSYTPATGYLGTDSFEIQLDCSQTGKTKKIYVTVNPYPVVAAITAATDTVCKGKTITLADATARGVWSAASTAVSVSANVVTGVAAGTTTVSYTVTALGCSTSATYTVKVKDCNLGTSNPSVPKGELLIYPNPVKEIVHVDGGTQPVTYRLMNMLGCVITAGTLDNVSNAVRVNNVVSGVYMLEVSNSEGEKTINRVIKQ